MFSNILNFVIVGLLIYAYFVYVFVFCGALKQSMGYFFSFNSLFLMVVWFYLLLVFKPHKSIKTKYKLSKKMMHKLNLSSFNDGLALSLTGPQNKALEMHVRTKRLNIKTRNEFGQLRLCLKCRLIQPDRSYHCHKCKRCILKRDHHCVWLNQCIGHSNQKYFILFLTNLLMLVIFIGTSLFETFIQTLAKLIAHEKIDNYHICILYVLNTLMALPLMLLFLNTAWLACLNMTNMEQTYPPVFNDYISFSLNMFDLGLFKNLKQIFGSNVFLANWPIWTTIGDGHVFETNELDLNNIA